MEQGDKELIRRVTQSNAQLRRLYEEHVVLEDELRKFEKRGFLTPEEEMEEKKLKKKKLSGVDRMMSIIAPLREETH